MGGKSGGGGRECVLGVLKEEVEAEGCSRLVVVLNEVEGISADAEAPALLDSRLEIRV